MKKRGKNRRKKTVRYSGQAGSGKDRLSIWWLIGALIVGVLVTGIILLSHWLGGQVRSFSCEDGLLTDLEGSTQYMRASGNYEAVSALRDVYGRAGELSLHGVAYKNKLGQVIAADTSRYLTDGKGTLFISSAVLLPGLSSFGCEVMYVCTDTEDELTLALASFSSDTDYRPEDIIDEYLNAPAYDMEKGGAPQTTYKLYLSSPVKYPAFYYVMSLVHCDNGDFYIYTQEDRVGRRIRSRYFEKIFASGEDPAETSGGSGEEVQ